MSATAHTVTNGSFHAGFAGRSWHWTQRASDPRGDSTDAPVRHRRHVAVPAVRRRAITRPCRRELATGRGRRPRVPAAPRRVWGLVSDPGGLARLVSPRHRVRTAGERQRPRRRSVVGRAHRTAGAWRGGGHRERPDRLAPVPPREGLQHARRRSAGRQLAVRLDHLSRVRRAGALQRGDVSDLGLAGQRPAELHSRTAADRDPRRRRARLNPMGDGHLARAGERGQPAGLVRDHGSVLRQVRRPARRRLGRGPDLHAGHPALAGDGRRQREGRRWPRGLGPSCVRAVRQARRRQRHRDLRDRDLPRRRAAARRGSAHGRRRRGHRGTRGHRDLDRARPPVLARRPTPAPG